MKTPAGFYDFCFYLHQDADYVYGPELQDMISGALQHVPKERRPPLRAYLDHLLTGNYSDAQLMDIYHGAEPEMGIRRGVRHVFTMIRDTIDRDKLG